MPAGELVPVSFLETGKLQSSVLSPHVVETSEAYLKVLRLVHPLTLYEPQNPRTYWVRLDSDGVIGGISSFVYPQGIHLGQYRLLGGLDFQITADVRRAIIFAAKGSTHGEEPWMMVLQPEGSDLVRVAAQLPPSFANHMSQNNKGDHPYWHLQVWPITVRQPIRR